MSEGQPQNLTRMALPDRELPERIGRIYCFQRFGEPALYLESVNTDRSWHRVPPLALAA